MSFLQPWMLAALPLAAIPIIIHLINQRRYQSLPWGAMRFLLSANQMNRGYAKIRRWLILAFRTLVIAALVFAVGRPLLSGSLGQGVLGSIVGRGTETAFVLVDRSPSMQTRLGSSAATKRESSLTRVSETLETMGVRRVLVVESNESSLSELAKSDQLPVAPEFGPSAASADVPGMILTTLEKIRADQLGQTDIWICSDLQRNDWKPDDGRWTTIQQSFAELGRRVRFRLLSSSSGTAANRTLRVTRTTVKNTGGEAVAVVSLQVTSDSENDTTIPVTFEIDGSRSTVDVPLQAGKGNLVDHELPIASSQQRCQGSVSIPADACQADNVAYFASDLPPARRCVVVSDDEKVAEILRLATEIPSLPGIEHTTEVLATTQTGTIRWDEISLVIWQAPLPSESSGDAAAMKSFVDRGGQIVFLPAKSSAAFGSQIDTVFGVRWGDSTVFEEDVPVSTWRSDTDLLAATLSGASLPVGQLKVKRCAAIEGELIPLATLDDETMLLARAVTPRGGVYFCATTPIAADSSLGRDGIVLYVMLQRALSRGAASLGNTQLVDAGSSDPKDAAGWRRLTGPDEALSTENAFQSGVYLEPESDRWIAVNRTLAEDSLSSVGDEQLAALFEGLVFDRLESEGEASGSLVEEAWRAMLILMLIAMVGEAILCLPRVREAATVSGQGVAAGGTVA
ncbi:MAG: BatA domain-containing protein [Planctomycetota bacterium]